MISRAQAEAEASIALSKATLTKAGAKAEISKMRLDAKRATLEVQANGRRALNEADNLLTKEIVALKVELAKLEALPKVVAEMVKPAEKINSVNIHHVSGLGGSGSTQGGSAQKPVVNQALDSVMEMAVQLPALKKLGEELGMSMDKGVTGVTESLDKDVDSRNK